MKSPVAGPAKGHRRRLASAARATALIMKKARRSRGGPSGQTSSAGFLRYTFTRSPATRAGVLPAQEAGRRYAADSGQAGLAKSQLKLSHGRYPALASQLHEIAWSAVRRRPQTHGAAPRAPARSAGLARWNCWLLTASWTRCSSAASS